MVALSLHCLGVWEKLKDSERTDPPHLLVHVTVAVWAVSSPATIEDIINWLMVSASVERVSVSVLEVGCATVYVSQAEPAPNKALTVAVPPRMFYLTDPYV